MMSFIQAWHLTLPITFVCALALRNDVNIKIVTTWRDSRIYHLTHMLSYLVIELQALGIPLAASSLSG